MGSCCANKKLGSIDKLIAKKLADSIRNNYFEKVRRIISNFCIKIPNKSQAFDIDQPIIKIYNKDMNALGYSLFIGNVRIFSLILELGKAKLSSMNSYYAFFNRTPLDIICELGHVKLLEYYFPIHLLNSSEKLESYPDSLSLSTSNIKNLKTSNPKPKKAHKTTVSSIPTLSPLHKACEKSQINIISYFYEYSLTKTLPFECDIHYIDESTGDNCALVSCRTGNLDLISYLHEICKADFHIINKRNESAIQVLAVWSKKKRAGSFLECFKYLIDVVKVDITYEYEETILIVEDENIVRYLEAKLKSENIIADKENIDKKYALVRGPTPPVVDPALENRLSRVRGSNFSFKALFKKELEDSRIEISRISENNGQSSSRITFML